MLQYAFGGASNYNVIFIPRNFFAFLQWEPKASRCLQFEITDGLKKMKAIELEPLMELDTSKLVPGAKVCSLSLVSVIY